jgi:hypothetical protein
MQIPREVDGLSRSGAQVAHRMERIEANEDVANERSYRKAIKFSWPWSAYWLSLEMIARCLAVVGRFAVTGFVYPT